ncbi:MAG: hypothetical protein J1E40_05330 [Oscillospiraceae bacterium]|nr:hypothetical protein [Oscillospiraceae bacterium]
MDKMKETGRLIFILIFLIFYYWCLGVNINIMPYEPADPELPHAVTIDGRTVSLLSGNDNLSLALGYNFDAPAACIVNGGAKLIHFWEYNRYDLDPSGNYPDSCSIYNGITTASTKAELENAFGEDCIKIDNVFDDHFFIEIFIDDEEADYEKIDISEFEAMFENGCSHISDILFENTYRNYPQAKFITILTCCYYVDDYDNSYNDISFFVYDTARSKNI